MNVQVNQKSLRSAAASAGAAARRSERHATGAPARLLCGASEDLASAVRAATGEIGPCDVTVLPAAQIVAADPEKLEADIVLIDVAAPGQVDQDWLARMTQLAQTVPLLLVFDTAHAVAGARLALKVRAIDFVVTPLESPALVAAITGALAADGRQPATVTGVISAVGGAGGTSIAIAIADQLASEGSTTHLIDLDLVNAGCGLVLDALCTHDVTHDLGNLGRIDAEYLNVITKRVGALRVLSMQQPSTAIRDRMHDFTLRTLDVLERGNDHLVLDVPYWAPDRTVALLAAANRILVITIGTVPALKLAKDLVEKLVGEGCDPDAITVIVNRHKAGMFNGNRLDKKSIERILDPLAFAFVRDDEETLMDCVNCGMPPGAVSKKSPFVKDVAALVESGAPRSDDIADASATASKLVGNLLKSKKKS